MAIHLYTGPLGNGKTISAVGAAIEQTWFKGGSVFSNVSFKWEAVKEHFKKVYGAELVDSQFVPLTNEQIPEFYKHCQRGTREVPVLLIIDEAGRYFNSKAWNKGLSDKITNSDFLRESRKLHVEVIFIVQNEERLDKSFRELMEFRHRFRLFKWIPILNRFILQIKEDAQTDMRIKTRFWWCDRKYFNLYDTDSLYSNWDVAQVPEIQPVAFDKKPKKPVSLMMRFAILMAIAYFAWGWITKLGQGMGKSAAPAQQAAAVTPAPGAAPVSVTSPSGVITHTRSTVPAPLVIVENFRGTDGRTYLRTHAGEYIPSQWSAHGECLSIQARSAILRSPEGRRVVIVARDWQDPELVAAIREYAAKEAAQPAPFVPAQEVAVSSAEPRLADLEERRIKEWLKKPIGADNNKKRPSGMIPAVASSVPSE